MIRRYDILVDDCVWEGWAHNPEEMKQKFLEKQPQYTDCEVFDCEGAPKWLTLTEYRAIEEICSDLSPEVFKILWRRADQKLSQIYDVIEETR